MIKKNDFLNSLPSWAKLLARKYFTQTVSQFILHGAVRDIIHYNDMGKDKFYRVTDFLEEILFSGRDLVFCYDRSKGITFSNKETTKDFEKFLRAADTYSGSNYSKKIPSDPPSALRLLERYIRIRLADGKSMAFIIDYADTIIPQSTGGYMSESDRSTLVTLQRFANDPDVLAGDVTVVMITENLTDLHSAIVRSPFTEKLELPMPDLVARQKFILAKTNKDDYKSHFSVPSKTMAKLTSGLGLVHLLQIINEGLRQEVKVGMETLIARKKELIEAECYGLLEFFEPKYNLDMVAGHTDVKKELRDAAKMLKTGRLDVLPMGYLIAGPVGTGKTFLTTCFTGEIGIPCVKILNVRSQWQGVTESNMQKILTLFKAMGPLGVIIDEADAFLGDRDASGDSGTSSRLFSQIASFMSNTDYRGHILWFLLTCRPDLLPVDIKRQGRAEEHLALFHPESAKDRHELFQVFIKKNNVQTRVKSIEKIYKEVGAPKLSGADIEAVIIRAKKHAAVKGKKSVSERDFKAAFNQFIPPIYAEEVEYQTLAAVMECTNRNLIPKEYKDTPREKLAKRFALLGSYIK